MRQYAHVDHSCVVWSLHFQTDGKTKRRNNFTIRLSNNINMQIVSIMYTSVFISCSCITIKPTASIIQNIIGSINSRCQFVTKFILQPFTWPFHGRLQICNLFRRLRTEADFRFLCTTQRRFSGNSISIICGGSSCQFFEFIKLPQPSTFFTFLSQHVGQKSQWPLSSVHTTNRR